MQLGAEMSPDQLRGHSGDGGTVDRPGDDPRTNEIDA